MTPKKLHRNERVSGIIDEADRAEAEEELEEGRPYIRPLAPNDPSQVYSIRIPVERVEELRVVAAQQGKAPTALIREWVIAHLDQERDNPLEHRQAEAVVSQVLDELLKRRMLSDGPDAASR